MRTLGVSVWLLAAFVIAGCSPPPAGVRVNAGGVLAMAELRAAGAPAASCSVPCALQLPEKAERGDLTVTADGYYPARMSVTAIQLRQTAASQDSDDGLATLVVPLDRRPQAAELRQERAPESAGTASQ
jgi:hypothetical protein